ncbi:UNVERIFIED_CONTAM: hypothetical protein K2H54_003554 [Gekko kuhli]
MSGEEEPVTMGINTRYYSFCSSNHLVNVPVSTTPAMGVQGVQKIQGWPDGVMAEHYHLGLHPEIRDMTLHTTHPVALNARMQEATDVEMIKIDDTRAHAQSGTPVMKAKVSNPPEGCLAMTQPLAGSWE